MARRCLLVCDTLALRGRTPLRGPGNGATKQPFCEPPPGFVHIVPLQEFNLHVFVIKERQREKKDCIQSLTHVRQAHMLLWLIGRFVCGSLPSPRRHSTRGSE